MFNAKLAQACFAWNICLLEFLVVDTSSVVSALDSFGDIDKSVVVDERTFRFAKALAHLACREICREQVAVPYHGDRRLRSLSKKKDGKRSEQKAEKRKR